MARVHREACFYFEGERDENDTSWQGVGWAKIPLDRFFGHHKYGWVVRIGKVRLRIIKAHLWESYVVRDNWRWPAWWALLRLWLALCWFERCLRLTAAVWGILRIPEPGAMPLWSDFFLVRLVRKHEPAR